MENKIHNGDGILNKYDSVLVNLNIIASIDTNDKLYIEDAKLCRHPYSSTRSITRWWNNYNREDCKKFITELYKEVSNIIILITSIVNKNIGSKHTRNKIKKGNKKRKRLLISTCQESKKGLLHLMMTYNNDPEFSKFINNTLHIIDKMD